MCNHCDDMAVKGFHHRSRYRLDSMRYIYATTAGAALAQHSMHIYIYNIYGAASGARAHAGAGPGIN